jgi:hypothetical protein
MNKQSLDLKEDNKHIHVNVRNFSVKIDFRDQIQTPNAFVGLLGGVAETTIGFLTAETGVGGFAILDGSSRTFFNGMRLVGYFSHSKEYGDGPSNMGAYFGKVLNNMPYTSSLTNGNAQAVLGAANDVMTFLITGGNGDSFSLLQKGNAIEQAASLTTIGANYYSVGKYGGIW